jgi:hypothetical protein
MGSFMVGRSCELLEGESKRNGSAVDSRIQVQRRHWGPRWVRMWVMEYLSTVTTTLNVAAGLCWAGHYSGLCFFPSYPFPSHKDLPLQCLISWPLMVLALCQELKEKVSDGLTQDSAWSAVWGSNKALVIGLEATPGLFSHPSNGQCYKLHVYNMQLVPTMSQNSSPPCINTLPKWLSRDEVFFNPWI